MRLLDLFCGAGGCAMGYHRAGFSEVVGVDIAPQPRYPFEFVQGDALEYVAEHGHEFDVIHASPPCQAYSSMQFFTGNIHPELIDPTRELLMAIGKPYVIENVPGAPLVDYLLLCGTMFGLRTRRHRLFESNPPLWFPPASCSCRGRTGVAIGAYQTPEGGDLLTITGHNFSHAAGVVALGVDWMSRGEMAQAIPPAYTEYIGGFLLELF